MKAFKIGLLVVGGLLLLLVVAVALLFVPAVQKSVVTRVVSDEERTLEVEYLRAGLGGVSARGLVLTEPDASYRVGELEAEVSLMGAVFGGEIRIGNLRAVGVAIDLSEKEEDEEDEEDEESDEEVFEGILEGLRLPMPVYLEKAEVDGVVSLPERKVAFSVRGGGLAPGKEGKFSLAANLAENGENGAELLEIAAELSAAETADGGFSRIELTLNGTGNAGSGLRLTADLRAVEGGEEYAARVFSADGEGAALVTVDGAFDDGERLLTADWALRFGSAEIAALGAALALPEFLAEGSGRVVYGEAEGFGVTGTLAAEASDLRVFSEELGELGAFSLRSDFDVAAGEEEVRVTSLAAEISHGGRAILEVRNSREVRYLVEEARVAEAEEGAELASAVLRDLPVEWANVFLGGETPEESVAVEGGLLNGEFSVSVEEGGISFRSARPLVAEGVAVRSGGEEILREISLRAVVSGALREAGLVAELEELVLAGAGAELLRATGNFDGENGRAELSFAGEIGAWAGQPVLAAAGEMSGKLAVDLAANLAEETAEFSATGNLREVVWGDFPGATMRADFALAGGGEFVELRELAVEARDGERAILEVRNFQGIRYGLESGEISGSGEGADLLTVSARGFPLEMANVFLAAAEGGTGPVFAGGILDGELRAGLESGGTVFRTVEAIRAEGIGMRDGEEWILRNVGLEAVFGGRIADGEIAGEVERLRVLGGRAPMLDASWKFDGGKLEASVRVALPALLAQPVLAELNNASEGIATVEIAADFGERMSAEVTARTSGIRLRRERETAPDLTLSVKVAETAEGRWTVDAPLAVAGEEPGDARVAGTFSTVGELTEFAVELTSSFLRVDDLLAVAAAFSGEEAEEETPETETAEGEEAGRDEVPFWSGFRGTVALAMEDLRLPGGHPLEELRGELRVEEAAMRVAAAGRMLESPVEVSGEVVFAGGEEMPYALTGNLEAPELSAAPFFRQQAPDQPPTVEGIFGVSASLRGDGENLGDLMERARGEMRMRAGEGVLRLFRTDNPVAGLGMAVGGILGSLSPEVGAVVEIARNLSQVPFSEMNLFLERDEDLNFLLRDFRLISPELHLAGVGEVRYREGVAALRQPMRIELQLGAQGGLEKLLGAVRVLGAETDSLGYRLMRQEFVITGTPAKPDNAAFYRLLADTAMRFLGTREETDSGGEERTGSERPVLEDVLRGLFR